MHNHHSATDYIEYILKPSWSRILHRLHTLGKTRQSYQNSLVNIVTEGSYPMHIASASEEKSYSMDGVQEWSYNGWERGLVKVSPTLKLAEFQFFSKNGEMFHQVTLTPQSEWSCFECLLRLFEHSRVELKSDDNYLLPTGKKVNHCISRLCNVLNREIIRGKRVVCFLPLAGESQIKNVETKSLMTRYGRIALKHANSFLQLNTFTTEHLEIDRSSNRMITTLYDSKHEPQLILQAS